MARWSEGARLAVLAGSVATMMAAGVVVTAPGSGATPVGVTQTGAAVAASHGTSRAAVLRAAAGYAAARGYHVGIAVYDTRTRHLYSAGDHTGTFATESVAKVFIATRLLVQGRMHGATARRAWKMITQSDDAIASSFYGSVGGDSLINWIKKRYHLPHLGSPPHRAGWWGNTHIRPDGLVRLYAKLQADRRVGPWLLRAMHHAHRYGSDGTYQFFGLPSATRHPAIKQGWGTDYDDWERSADFNTTGFVDGDRYTVAILARGPVSTYGTRIASMLTAVARRLLPHGEFPLPPPTLRSISAGTGPMSGGTRLVLHGRDLTGVRAVYFGRRRASSVASLHPGKIAVVTPPHAAGRSTVRVVSTHGRSAAHGVHFTFGPRPDVRATSNPTGAQHGGDVVTLHGHHFRRIQQVRFGDKAAASFRRLSPTTIRAVTPAHWVGTVHVHVVTAFGASRAVPGDRFTYAVAPRVRSLSVSHGPPAGGTRVVLRGAGFSRDSTVRFGGKRAQNVIVRSVGRIVAVSPAHAPGHVSVRVTTPVGRSAATRAARFVYRSTGTSTRVRGHARRLHSQR